MQDKYSAPGAGSKGPSVGKKGDPSGHGTMLSTEQQAIFDDVRQWYATSEGGLRALSAPGGYGKTLLAAAFGLLTPLQSKPVTAAPTNKACGRFYFAAVNAADALPHGLTGDDLSTKLNLLKPRTVFSLLNVYQLKPPLSYLELLCFAIAVRYRQSGYVDYDSPTDFSLRFDEAQERVAEVEENWPGALKTAEQLAKANIDEYARNPVLLYQAVREIHLISENKYFGWVPRILPTYPTHALLIVDEASMVGCENDLWRLRKIFTHVLLVGDDQQLGPIGKVNDKPLTCAMRSPDIEKMYRLTQNFRQGDGSTSREFAERIRRNDRVDSLAWDLPEITMEECVKRGIPIVTYRNATRVEASKSYREERGWSKGELYEGERLIVRDRALVPEYQVSVERRKEYTANLPKSALQELVGRSWWTPSPESLVYNEEVVIREVDKDWVHFVYSALPGDLFRLPRRVFKFAEYNETVDDMASFRFAYGTTAHNAQGSEWLEVAVALQDVPAARYWAYKEERPEDFSRWLYTSVSRSKQHTYRINSVKSTRVDFERLPPGLHSFFKKAA